MNKVTKTAIAGLLALFAGNAAATDGEIVFDGEILKSACEINDSDKKIEVALGHYNAEQFRNIGERSPKIPGNDSNLLIVFYVQIMPDDFVMQLHR
ncbi:fimbrial protein, partial [Escherichia coli]|uniref:fimbrial protein n=5 Tax=Escherichia coli TaxID=562 RepID=UPI0024A75E50